jgi:hypothetical protein
MLDFSHSNYINQGSPPNLVEFCWMSRKRDTVALWLKPAKCGLISSLKNAPWNILFWNRIGHFWKFRLLNVEVQSLKNCIPKNVPKGFCRLLGLKIIVDIWYCGHVVLWTSGFPWFRQANHFSFPSLLRRIIQVKWSIQYSGNNVRSSCHKYSSSPIHIPWRTASLCGSK